MVHLFEDTNLCAIHAKRVTISERRGGGSAAGWSRSRPTLQPRCCPCTAGMYRLAQRGGSTGAADRRRDEDGTTAGLPLKRPHLPHPTPAVAKDLQLARRIRGPVYGVSSY
jgi:hypothetical protein